MQERYALLYDDGSNTVLAEGTTLGEAQDERRMADDGETDPAKMTKLATVEFSVKQIIHDPTAAVKHG